jgi:hypothetical protein
MGISIISYGKNSLNLRPTWVTTSPRERIDFVIQGSTVSGFPKSDPGRILRNFELIRGNYTNHLYTVQFIYRGRVSSDGIAIRYRADRHVNRIPVGGKFSHL